MCHLISDNKNYINFLADESKCLPPRKQYITKIVISEHTLSESWKQEYTIRQQIIIIQKYLDWSHQHQRLVSIDKLKCKCCCRWNCVVNFMCLSQLVKPPEILFLTTCSLASTWDEIIAVVVWNFMLYFVFHYHELVNIRTFTAHFHSFFLILTPFKSLPT